MKVIYEPKGRAREYSELACNLYRGCTHGCRYCFGPAVLRTTKEQFHTMAGPRKDIIELFEEDAKKLKDDTRHILFCFTSDPYQPLERTERLTHQALEIVKEYGLNSQVLTKGKADLIHEDLELMKVAGTHFGITLCFSDDETRKYWEPDASPVNERLAILKEAHEAALSLNRGTVGDNVMYFETGQGSALSANAHHGVDQQTCEARAYAVAREFRPLLVNTVVGFIGPEYLYDGKQITRAGLEDHFCGKLLGLPMGCDICYTNHAEVDQNDMDGLMTLLGAAGVTFIMGIPGADDIMLNYQSTSFHDALYLRQVMGLKRAPEFDDWLMKMGISDESGVINPVGIGHGLLSQLPHLPQSL